MFNKILITVDHSIFSQVAIEKSIQLCDDDAEIHLMDVRYWSLSDVPTVGSLFMIPVNQQAAHKQREDGLNRLALLIKELNNKLAVSCWYTQGPFAQMDVSQKAIALNCTMIVIGSRNSIGMLPFLQNISQISLSQQTGIPVLSLGENQNNGAVRNVMLVVPGEMSNFTRKEEAMYTQKFELIRKFTGNSEPSMHMVTNCINYEQAEKFSHAYFELYQWTRIHWFRQMEYAITCGQNRMKTIMHHAKVVNADLLVIFSQMKLKTGWFDYDISVLAQRSQNLKVLVI